MKDTLQMKLAYSGFLFVHIKGKPEPLREACLGFPWTRHLVKYSVFIKGGQRHRMVPLLRFDPPHQRSVQGKVATVNVAMTVTQASSGINTLYRINRKSLQLLIVLAEEAVSGRYDPAGRHQGPGAEVHLADINGRHPGMSTWQSRVTAQDSAPGDG